jgi:hypothetical protein
MLVFCNSHKIKKATRKAAFKYYELKNLTTGWKRASEVWISGCRLCFYE